MNYKWHYDRLIETRKNRDPEEGKYYEKHHIVPKSMGGDNATSNMVKLTAREHFLAHWLLWRIHRNRQMACAFAYLCGSFSIKEIKMKSSRGYEEAKLSMINTSCSEKTRKRMSVNWNRSVERRKKISERNIALHKEKRIGMYNKSHTDEYKCVMKEKMKGNSNAKGYKFTKDQSKNLSIAQKERKRKPLSDEWKQTLRNVQYDKWIEKYGKEEADKRRKHYDECRLVKIS